MILLKISARYSLMHGLIVFRRWFVKPIQSELFFPTSCFIGSFTSSIRTSFKTVFPSYGFSIFFASEGPIFKKELLSVSESIVFATSDFVLFSRANQILIKTFAVGNISFIKKFFVVFIFLAFLTTVFVLLFCKLYFFFL